MNIKCRKTQISTSMLLKIMVEESACNKRMHAKKKHQAELALRLCIDYHSLRECVEVTP